MRLQTTSPFVPTGNANAWPPQESTNAHAWNVATPFSQTGRPYPLKSRDWMQDPEDRQAYMVASVEQDIAWQVRINRERRGWTQTQLAKMIATKQSAIARIEDPTYGKHSLVTLTKLAKVFNCALMLRLVNFEKFADETEDLREDSLYVKPYEANHDQ
ncbi:MAG: helix-turn-helix domain-containing protein [Betaproteobacteria bacterium]